MQTPLRLTFRHSDPSAALAARARELIARVERAHDDIIGCRIVIECPSAHHRNGGRFTVSVDFASPRSVIHSSSARSPRVSHEDPYVALRDAVERAERQLRASSAE